MRHALRPQQAGFTLIELMVTMVVLSILIGLVVVNLPSASRQTTLSTSLVTLTSDMKEQQLKAMTGDSEGLGTAANYGIYFATHSYTLFHGVSYNANDSTNFIVSVDPLTFQSTGTTLIFSHPSGDVVSYNGLANTISLFDSIGNTKSLHYNTYGVITTSN